MINLNELLSSLTADNRDKAVDTRHAAQFLTLPSTDQHIHLQRVNTSTDLLSYSICDFMITIDVAQDQATQSAKRIELLPESDIVNKLMQFAKYKDGIYDLRPTGVNLAVSTDPLVKVKRITVVFPTNFNYMDVRNFLSADFTASQLEPKVIIERLEKKCQGVNKYEDFEYKLLHGGYFLFY